MELLLLLHLLRLLPRQLQRLLHLLRLLQRLLHLLHPLQLRQYPLPMTVAGPPANDRTATLSSVRWYATVWPSRESAANNPRTGRCLPLTSVTMTGSVAKLTNSSGPSFSRISTRRCPPLMGGPIDAVVRQVLPISAETLCGILPPMSWPRPNANNRPSFNSTQPAYTPAACS